MKIQINFCIGGEASLSGINRIEMTPQYLHCLGNDGETHRFKRREIMGFNIEND